MSTVTVDIYKNKTEGLALDPKRPRTLESEIAEIELVQKSFLLKELGLPSAVQTCDRRLATLRCQRETPFPLMSKREEDIWKSFLPTVYATRYTTRGWIESSNLGVNRQGCPLFSYQFDLPPVSVLELWKELKGQNAFDIYEIWTPERPLPEPILVGYKNFDKKEIGPFLLAQWGESLEPFEEIVKKVEVQTGSFLSLQQAQAQLAQRQLSGQWPTGPTWTSTVAPATTTSGIWWGNGTSGMLR